MARTRPGYGGNVGTYNTLEELIAENPQSGIAGNYGYVGIVPPFIRYEFDGVAWRSARELSIVAGAIWASNREKSVEIDRAADAQLEFYENIMFAPQFFDPSLGADTGDGTAGRPYRDITASRLIPGRRHLIKAGTTVTCGAATPWLTIPSTGTENSPIIIGRYGDRHLPNPVIDGTATSQVIRGGTSAKNWRVRDIEIIGGAAGSTRFGISQNSLAAVTDAEIPYNIIISRVKIHGVVTDGATDCNGIKLYGANNTVLDCEIYDIATDAIWFHGYNTKISGCTIYRVAQDGRLAGDGIQCGAKSDGSIIRGNYVDHFEVDIKQCIYFELTVSVSSGVLIEDNYCVSADGTAGAAGPITCGATDSIVRRNFVKGGYVGILIGERGIAHNNVVISTVGRGIDCKKDSTVYNNTIMQTGSDTTQTFSVGIRAQTGDTNVTVRNNILIGQYNGILTVSESGAPNITESNNAFAIRGVSDAKFRVDGVVVSPTSPIVGSYGAWAATLGIDANFRPIANSVLFDAAVFHPAITADKDRKSPTRNTVGAFD